MKEGLCEIVVVLDKSGSMSVLTQETILGYNNFIQDQRKLPGEARATLVLFDTEYRILYNGLPISEVPELTNKEYFPNGWTALNDAVAKTILDVGKRLDETSEDEKPEKVIMTIITDGLENSSKEYDKRMIREMIEHQKSIYSWEFIYLGANQDAFAEGSSYGIDAKDINNYQATAAGISLCFNSANVYNASYRARKK